MNDLKYPVGPFTPPKSFSAAAQTAERDAYINTIESLPQQLSHALSGLSEAQLDTPYRPGGWTIRQLVHHIADSHMNALSRIRHGLTVEWPAIYAYQQAAWAELPDSRLPVDISVRILEGVHQRLVTVLRGIANADWSGRGYLHPENGRQSIEQVLPLYAWHSRHHLAHIVNCRARLGW